MTFRADRVPAWLVLPVVISTADHQTLLGPNNLRSNAEAVARQTFGHRGRMQSSMPDIGNVAGEEAPGGVPVCLLVVAHLAAPLGFVDPSAMTPGGVVANAVGRVGDHQVGRHSCEQSSDSGRICAVTASNAVRSRRPYLPDSRNRLRLQFWNVVFIGTAGLRWK